MHVSNYIFMMGQSIAPVVITSNLIHADLISPWALWITPKNNGDSTWTVSFIYEWYSSCWVTIIFWGNSQCSWRDQICVYKIGSNDDGSNALSHHKNIVAHMHKRWVIPVWSIKNETLSISQVLLDIITWYFTWTLTYLLPMSMQNFKGLGLLICLLLLL